MVVEQRNRSGSEAEVEVQPRGRRQSDGGRLVEERVVARLLEKLQLISHTVGDVEAILESCILQEAETKGPSKRPSKHW